MTEKEFKSKFKRVAKFRRMRWWAFSYKKNKFIKSGFTGFGYACECGCNSFGNSDLYMVDFMHEKKPMTLKHGLKLAL